MTHEVAVGARTFFEAVDQTLSVVDVRDAARPKLTGVYLQVGADRALRFVGTDGFALVSVRAWAVEEVAEPFEVILSGRDLKTNLPALKRFSKARPDARIRLEVEIPTEARVEAVGGSFAVGVIEGSYPRIDNLIPPAHAVGDAEVPRSRFAVNGALLGRVLTKAATYGDGRGIVRVRPPKLHTAPVRLDWASADGGWSALAVVMPMFTDNWGDPEA